MEVFILVLTNKLDKKMKEKKNLSGSITKIFGKKMKKINTLSKEEYKYLKNINKKK